MSARLLTPAQVAEMLQLDVDEIVALVLDGRLRGAKVGSPAVWRVEAASVEDYLDDQAEDARLHALWRESNAASFPELWGRGRRGGE
jgi:excisionase family DNA binding protein